MTSAPDTSPREQYRLSIVRFLHSVPGLSRIQRQIQADKALDDGIRTELSSLIATRLRHLVDHRLANLED